MTIGRQTGDAARIRISSIEMYEGAPIGSHHDTYSEIGPVVFRKFLRVFISVSIARIRASPRDPPVRIGAIPSPGAKCALEQPLEERDLRLKVATVSSRRTRNRTTPHRGDGRRRAIPLAPVLAHVQKHVGERVAHLARSPKCAQVVATEQHWPFALEDPRRGSSLRRHPPIGAKRLTHTDRPRFHRRTPAGRPWGGRTDPRR